MNLQRRGETTFKVAMGFFWVFWVLGALASFTVIGLIIYILIKLAERL